MDSMFMKLCGLQPSIKIDLEYRNESENEEDEFAIGVYH